MELKGIKLTQDFIRRFWRKVKKGDKCWLFQGTPLNSGYCQIKHGGKYLLVHRVSYLLHNGTIDDTLMVLHSCDNRICVNPAHLRQGTCKDNSQDMVKRNRSARGMRHGMVKFPQETVSLVRILYQNGMTKAAIARELKVSESQVRNICFNRSR